MNLNYNWDVIKYIANFISDPITFERYGQCCKRTYQMVKQLRAQKEKEYINNVNDYSVVNAVIKCKTNAFILISGHSGSGRTTLMNYIVNKMNPNIQRIRIEIGDILRNPFSFIHIYERILCKKLPVYLIIKGTEEYTFDELDRLFACREIGEISWWKDRIINIFPQGSILIAVIKKRKGTYFNDTLNVINLKIKNKI